MSLAESLFPKDGHKFKMTHLKAETTADLYAREFPAQNWTVDRLVPHGSVTAISGDPGKGKTWIALHMLDCVSTGAPFLGHFPTVRATSVLVDEENRPKLLRDRLTLLMHDPKRAPIHLFSKQGFNVTDRKHTADLLGYCAERNIRFIVFDSLVRIHAKDENSASEMRLVTASLDQIAQLGISVVILHHHSKGGFGAQRMRGSGDILASVSSHLTVAKDGRMLHFEQPKCRDAEEIAPFDAEMISSGGYVTFNYRGMPERTEVKVDANQAVLAVIESAGKPVGTREIDTILRQSGNPIGEKRLAEILRSVGGRLTVTKGPFNSNLYEIATDVFRGAALPYKDEGTAEREELND